MADENSAAQPGPEAKAQTSGEEKKRVGNVSGAEAAAMFLKKEPAATKPAAEHEATASAEDTTPATEEPQGTSAEANPEDAAEAKTQEADTEAEDKADEDLSKSTTLDPKIQERINRRIGKEVAKRKALEAQLNGVQAQLAEMQSAQQAQSSQVAAPAIPDGSPLAKIEDIAGLQKLHADAKEAVRFADDALERARDGEALPDGWTKESLRQIRREAQAHLEELIPARVQFLQQRHAADQKAHESFPFLKDKTTAEYLAAQNLLRVHPELNHSAHKNTALGLMVLGLQMMHQKAEAAKKAAEKPKAPAAKPASDQTAVSAGATSTRAPAVAQRQALAKAESELKAKGNVSGSDAARFLAQRELARTSR